MKREKIKPKKEMIMRKEIHRGDRITYEKEIMFKGAEKVTATVVAILGRYALPDNGDEILVY